jgi:3-deoxy-D-manno-octulosonate 8-phosphate phosphatase KdsC-like HAD superfamily phosphatase
MAGPCVIESPDTALAVATAAAVSALDSCCHVSTTRAGEQGAVREVGELIVQAQGKWEKVVAPFLGAA